MLYWPASGSKKTKKTHIADGAELTCVSTGRALLRGLRGLRESIAPARAGTDSMQVSLLSIGRTIQNLWLSESKLREQG